MSRLTNMMVRAWYVNSNSVKKRVFEIGVDLVSFKFSYRTETSSFRVKSAQASIVP